MGVAFCLESLSGPISWKDFMRHADELANLVRFDKDIVPPRIYLLEKDTLIKRPLLPSPNMDLAATNLELDIHAFTKEHWDDSSQRLLHLSKGDVGGQFFLGHYTIAAHKLFYQSFCWNDIARLEELYRSAANQSRFKVTASGTADIFVPFDDLPMFTS